MTKTLKFISKAQLIHGDKYDYSKVIYITAHEDIIITCRIHGDFEQRPDAHLHQKQGCPTCGLENRKSPLRKTTEQFKIEAKAKWGDLYDYSLIEYKNKYSPIQYTCKIHGVQIQQAKQHLKNGCPYCAGRGIAKYDKESLVKRLIEVHGDLYDYSLVEINSVVDKIDIICKKHGSFSQRATNHINGNGCPVCAKLIRTSKAEKELVAFIKANYNGLILENDREALNGKEIDIYLSELKLGIEYHGLYFHTETARGKNHHYDKWKIANDKGIHLMQIYSNEYEGKEHIVKNEILSNLDKNQNIPSESTKIVSIDKHTKNEFLDKNHLQGSDSSKICYGLEYDGEMVSIMTFGPSRFNKNYKYELLRFCNKIDVSVVGGAGKLLNHFRNNYEGSIISYADKRYSSGGLYTSLGFVLDGETEPSFGYFNIKNNKLYNRMKFQKQYLVDMPGYDPALKEYEIMQLNGYDRIWDCGQFRFVIL